ncbi:3'(2'),5'-bisphosphate nucleotidase [Marinilabiliaceae bacterium JC017]|nr:3'(2'),5'-bisphosphate nucleotidase [Marinilabiliaceae bacterium JC017]
MNFHNQYTALIVEAAISAGRAIMDVYHRDDFKVQLKEDLSPLTEADLKSNAIIEEYLQQTGIPVLSEEGRHMSYDERKEWSALWIVDPLDGTKEFVKRNGEFTVNIALVKEGYPVIGVVFAPWLGDLYVGDGLASYYFKLSADWKECSFDEIEKDLNPVNLPSDKTQQITMVVSISHFSEETADFIKRVEARKGAVDKVSVGSSLKMCLVAAGKADVYPRFGPTMEWDTAAGQAVLEAAGAKLIDLEQKKRMRYNRENLKNTSFLAMGKGEDMTAFIR